MRRTILPLILVCLSLMLCGCGTKTPENTEEPSETPEIELAVETTAEMTPVLPEATSDDLKLYSYLPSGGSRYVVNEYGMRDRRFSFDRDGNIVDSDGAFVIMEENVKLYRPIRTMYFGQERYQLLAEGDRTNTGYELSSAQVYSNCADDPDFPQHFLRLNHYLSTFLCKYLSAAMPSVVLMSSPPYIIPWSLRHSSL